MYKMHRKPLTNSSQSFEFYSCYLGKDAGYDHADMAMSDNIDPNDYSMWMAEYVLIRGDLFKDKIALDYDNNMKILHGVYNANLFPLPASHFTTLLFSLRLVSQRPCRRVVKVPQGRRTLSPLRAVKNNLFGSSKQMSCHNCHS